MSEIDNSIILKFHFLSNAHALDKIDNRTDYISQNKMICELSFVFKNE